MKRFLLVLISFLSVIALSAQSVSIRGVVRPSGTPTVFINPNLLPNFTNITGSFSTSQSVGVSGSGLTANVTVTAPTGFEISPDNSTFSSPTITLTKSGTTVSATVWVRVKSSTAAGPYGPVNVTFASTGATTANCSVTATVSSSGSPTVAASPTTLSGFATTVGTQSASQVSAISGSNLTGNITITAPAGYLVSPDNTSFFSSIILTNSGGSVPSTNVFFAISSGAAIGSPAGNATIVSSGASTVNIALSGTVSSSSAIDSVVAKFFFRRTSTTVAGWTTVFGDPTAGVVSATDPTNFQHVGITSIAGKWVPLSGSSALDAGGGGSNTDFPTSVVTGLWYHAPAGFNGPFVGFVAGDTNLVITNLDPTKLYSIESFSSQDGTSIGCPSAFATIYYVDSTNNRVDSSVGDTKNNSSSIFKTNKRPDANGRIKLGIYPQATGNNGNCSQFGVINGIIVKKQVTREGFDNIAGIILLLLFTIGLIKKKRKCLIEY